MADTIERTIYKLEIDDSGYVRGLENLSASTNKFSEAQQRANQRLQTNETALRSANEFLAQSKKELDNYTGTNERYRQQLLKTFQDAEKEQQKLTQLVQQNRQEYEKATKAAQDFANTSQRAAGVQGRVAPQVQPQTAARITEAIGAADVGELSGILNETTDDFERLRISILAAEEAMKGMNQESEDFKVLAESVDLGKKALSEYDRAAARSDKSTLSLRTQIRLGREELVKLEQAGKGNTKQYFELEKQVAKLTDAYGDQQQRIRILASDTKLLDFGKGAITAATSAFQAYTAVSILAGDQSEELQKKTLQLFAAMQLLQSLEQLSNLTRREGVLATLAQSGAQAAYTAVVGASTGALRAFRIALAATGIGAAIAGITFLVLKFNELREEQEKLNRNTKELQEVNEEAIKSFSSEVTHLKLIKERLNDLSVPQKQRINLAKEYNKTADEGNKIDIKQIDNIALVNKAIDSQIEKIKERARTRAAENVIVQKQEAVFLAEEQARNKAIAEQQAQIKAGQIIFTEEQAKDNFFVQLELRNQILKNIAKDPKVVAANKELEDSLKNLSPVIKIGDTIKPGTESDTKPIENEFAKRLAELQAKLAEVTAKSFESEGTIRKQFQASLNKEISEIQALPKEKLTPEQKEILIDLVVKINDVQLNEALDQFNKKVADARKKLDDEINSLQQKNIEDSINLLQDEFERRKELIEFNEAKEIETVKENTQKRLDELNNPLLFLTIQEFQDEKNRIVKAGEDEQTNIIIRANQQRQQLAIDTIKDSLDKFTDIIKNSKLIGDKAALEEITALTDAFNTGTITYENYKKELAKIQKKYEDAQLQKTIDTLEREISHLKRKINNTLDLTAKEYDDLIALVRQKEQELTDARIKQKTDVPDPNIKRKESFQDYVEAVGRGIESIVSFWQKANEAERESLERSIELQEERVNAALRIAERGNASYLRQEEDKLNELRVARENAARRELAINAALQSSQLLVGITGAIAKIATPGIGVAETIAAIATIFAALATGYGLVRSLQANQPRFKKGTTYVRREKEPKGEDTIPAWLTEGEAVLPEKTNKKYKRAVEAIYHEKIPAETINNFVTNYKKPTKEVIHEGITNKEKFDRFYNSVSKITMKELNKFIDKYKETERSTLVNEILKDRVNETFLTEKESKEFKPIIQKLPEISPEKIKQVNNFHTIKQIQQPNYQRIKEAAEIKINQDGKTAYVLNEQNNLIKENNDLQRQILRYLKNMGVNVSLDQHGFAVTQMEVIEQIKRDKFI